jgi:hypothetical protein
LSSRGLEIGTFDVSAVLGCGEKPGPDAEAPSRRFAAGIKYVIGSFAVEIHQASRPVAEGRVGNASTAIVLQVLLDPRQAIEALEADVDDARLVLPDLPAQ